MEQKKVFLIGSNLAAGGIETAFLHFVSNMRDSVDLDVFLCSNSGVLKDNMPKDVCVYEGNKILRNTNRADSIDSSANAEDGAPARLGAKARLVNFIKRALDKLHVDKHRIVVGVQSVGVNLLKKPKKQYDVAICFCAQHLCCENIALKRVNAKEKWAVIHADVRQVNYSKKLIKTLAKFDKILCVSSSCAEIFKGVYPHLKDKVDYIYNFQDNKKIVEKSKEFTVQYPITFNMVSVARLFEQDKGIIRFADVLKRLHDEGYDFCYHVIGGGVDEQKMKDHVKKIGAEDYILFYGQKANLYPFVKKADLLVLCSYHESWGLVVAEALTLGTPVLSTKTSSSEELIADYGTVCENSSDGLYSSLKDILHGKIDLKTQRENLKNYTYDNKKIKDKVLYLLENVK